MGQIALPESPLAPARRRPAAWVEREALLVALVGIYAVALTAVMPLQLAQDSWLTLLGGREIAWHGLPHRDALGVVTQGEEWIDQQWGAKLAFYEVFRLGGLKLALLAHVALLVSALGLGAAAARRRGASPASVFWIGAAAILVAPWSWQLRAQSFAYPLLAALLWLLVSDARSPSRRVFLVLPLLCLWANLHGSVVLGAALVALRGLTHAFDRIRSGSARGRWPVRSGVLVLGPALCVFASPYGFALAGYYRRLLVNPDLAQYVGEWRPSTLPDAWRFFVLVLVALWIVARNHDRLTHFEKLALLSTAAGGFLAIRSVVWFALAAAVIVPAAIAATESPRHSRTFVRLAAVAACALVLSVALAVARAPEAYERGFPPEAARAVAAAAARDPSVQVFASERYADWLLWREPELSGRLAFDVRFELLAPEDLRRLFAFHSKLGSDWMAVTDGYRLLVLDRAEDGALEPAFLAEDGIRVLYRDEAVSVLLRPPA